jgi:protocatechuate 3,4-dioxygenase beta subunit
MDNDDKTIGRILTRREALSLAATGGLALLVGGRATTAFSASQGKTTLVDLVATPEITEGPFFVDEMLKRSNLLGDTKRASVVEGVPLKFKVVVYDLKGTKGVPLSGAHVDIWHCDAAGAYSGESQQDEDTSGESWLRGYQITDKDGSAVFETIYPGWYPGRAVHIHFKVRTHSKSGNVTHDFSSQWFFEEALNEKVMAKAPYDGRDDRRVRNSRDGIYGARQADGTPVGSHLMMPLKESGTGAYHGEFSIALNLER